MKAKKDLMRISPHIPNFYERGYEAEKKQLKLSNQGEEEKVNIELWWKKDTKLIMQITTFTLNNWLMIPLLVKLLFPTNKCKLAG